MSPSTSAQGAPACQRPRRAAPTKLTFASCDAARTRKRERVPTTAGWRPACWPIDHASDHGADESDEHGEHDRGTPRSRRSVQVLCAADSSTILVRTRQLAGTQRAAGVETVGRWSDAATGLADPHVTALVARPRASFATSASATRARRPGADARTRRSSVPLGGVRFYGSASRRAPEVLLCAGAFFMAGSERLLAVPRYPSSPHGKPARGLVLPVAPGR